MPKPSSVRSKSRPILRRDAVEHVGDQVAVDERQHERADDDAPDRPEAAEDDHREHEDGERERELVGVDLLDVGAQERAGHAAHRRADRVGEQLDLDGRDAHGHGGDLVLADGDPGTAEPRVAQAEVDEQHDHHQQQREVVPGSQVQRGELPEERQVRLVDRVDADLAVGEVLAADVLAVDRGAADDLTEREGHDGDVVAPQPQRREAEDGAEQRRQGGRRDDDQDVVEVDARQVLGEVRDADVQRLVDERLARRVEEARAEPADRVRADGEEGHVAEVEQAGEADDHVEAERHDHVGERVRRVVDERRAGLRRTAAAAPRPRWRGRRRRSPAHLALA